MKERFAFSLTVALGVFLITLFGMVFTKIVLDILGPVWLGVAFLVGIMAFAVILLVETLTDKA